MDPREYAKEVLRRSPLSRVLGAYDNVKAPAPTPPPDEYVQAPALPSEAPSMPQPPPRLAVESHEPSSELGPRDMTTIDAERNAVKGGWLTPETVREDKANYDASMPMKTHAEDRADDREAASMYMNRFVETGNPKALQRASEMAVRARETPDDTQRRYDDPEAYAKEVHRQMLAPPPDTKKRKFIKHEGE